MDRYKTVYVIAPRLGATGGIELAHQLVDYLRNQGKNAFIVYATDYSIKGEISNDLTVTEEYKKYNIAVTDTIEDSEENMLVLPEIFFDFIYKYKKIWLGCWWMSVDNRYVGGNFWQLFSRTKSLHKKYRLLREHFHYGKYLCKNSDSLLLREDRRIFHFYQSRYAQQQIYSIGCSKVLPLFDYINVELFNRDASVKKEDIVLYNPIKGLKFTKKIMARLPNVKFVALEGLSRKQLSQTLDRAKLYIDFGHFPGKDRLPREAAMHHCCVVTGKNGASFFYEDVPLPDKYKFDTTAKNIGNIASMIEYILANYEECAPDFDRYRKAIASEQAVFYSQVDEFF